jgi:hypothetical protein
MAPMSHESGYISINKELSYGNYSNRHEMVVTKSSVSLIQASTITASYKNPGLPFPPTNHVYRNQRITLERPIPSPKTLPLVHEETTIGSKGFSSVFKVQRGPYHVLPMIYRLLLTTCHRSYIVCGISYPRILYKILIFTDRVKNVKLQAGHFTR